ncbi:amino acid adenylation domain-containing protein [Nannocystis exedens]|uniref:Amino acid adenylation domain-containing protein n=1 Tax=Nannocystis exedens TaxID=54 RepID=A0A1I2I3D1_9BACT|nr:non-ribosomal peptide synthetase [Nannocystis exedens]PCC68476.1 non-ribosomal peptide synthetase [Nannocystis exedens]SFF36120.1 amino acid adenylation domain-containing protein [Nannocystis exedens]
MSAFDHSPDIALPTIVQERARECPDRRAFTFLVDGESEERSWTYGELDRRARAIAAALQAAGAAGRPVLLVDPPGLGAIAALLGCMAAGAIAVPVAPPDELRSLERLRAIVDDSRAEHILSASPEAPGVAALREHTPNMRWVTSRELNGEGWDAPPIDMERIALIQYTSGSTATPRGVVLTHRNLIHNERSIAAAFENDERTIVAGWLPLHHDMGLIGTVLQPLYLGAPAVLMAPSHFLQRPIRWLQAIARHRATTSGGPNFAYELCIRKTTPEQRAALDLSCWRVAFNGAEPVRADTMERFAAAFAAAGFRREAFYPCYGLAEATLLCTGGRPGEPAKTMTVTADAGDGGRERVLVGCGRVLGGQELAIVDPHRLRACEPGALGEVWIRGDSVGQGYWGRPEDTREVFGARLDGAGDRPFLRTGDLGLMRGDELYIAGRLKDLIILKGRNHYPQDIERSVVRSHPGMREGCGAAFSVVRDGEERAVVVQEIDPAADRELLLRAAREAVFTDHGVALDAVVLLHRGTIFKTTSGKIQRRRCRAAYLAGELAVAASWQAPAAGERPAFVAPRPGLEAELAALWTEVLDVAPIGRDDDFFALGGGSLLATQLGARVRAALGLELSLAALFSARTLAATAAALALAGDDGIAREASPPEPRGRIEPEPLAFAQRGIWLVRQLDPDSPAYTIAQALRLTGALEVAALERALAGVIARHATLRTRIVAIDGEPRQAVDPPGAWSLAVEDLRGRSAEARATALTELGREAARTVFDVSAEVLLRARLVRVDDAEHVLLLAVDHLAADGWSMRVLLREVTELYAAELAGRAPALPPLAVEYADYCAWQRERLQEARLEQLLAYWRERLAGLSPAPALPDDRRSGEPGRHGATRRFELPSELSRAVRALGQREGVTLYMTLLAAFFVLLHRLGGQTDLRVGSPFAGRDHAVLEPLIGCFVNTLVVRCDLAGDPSFRALLGRVKEAALGAYAHAEAPFDKLVEALQPERDGRRMPLVDVGFVLQPDPLADQALPGLRLELLELDGGTSKIDLTLFITDAEPALRGAIEYDTALFAPATVDRLIERYTALLAGVVEAPGQRLSRLPILGADERAWLLTGRNPPAFVTPPVRSIAELFDAQAARTPDAEALVWGDARLTYAELHRRADRLARLLRRRGVGPETMVGVCLDRSLEMVVAVLAVIKSGGAYVPLDPSYPVERLAQIVADSAPRLVLTEARHTERLPASAGVLLVDREQAAIAAEPAEPLAVVVGPENLAYAIHTSGSTGRPKGVMVTHRSLIGACAAWERIYRLREVGSAMLQMASISFDVFAEDLMRALCFGKKLVLCPREVVLDPRELYALLVRERIDWAEFVPAGLRSLVAYLEETGQDLRFMRVIVAGSDSWFVHEYRRFKRLGAADTRLVNSYGMSEATIDNASYEDELADYPAERMLPAGRPFANTRLYVLDPHMQPAPIGVAGEIYVGGPCLARGYLGRPELTAERFVPDPFAGEPGARLYRSGDRGRILASGDLEFLGRLDNRVKIRGSLIELGDVESAIGQHPSVREVAAVVRDDPRSGEPRLLAYVVADPRALEEGADDGDLPAEQVAQWKAVFDDLYAETSAEFEPTLYIKGWESSYTKTPMPREEVRAWVEQTADRLRALGPREVLDLGSGSGLMLLRLADGCTRYVATDVSQAPLDFLADLLARRQPPLPQVRLEQRAADALADLAPASFDAVISVSVAQYFPGVDYLLRVLGGAVRAVRPGGFVFLGDVRSLPLLELYHTSVQLHRAGDATTCDELRQQVRDSVFYEKQMVVDPALFFAFQAEHPEVARVEVLLERGHVHNELNKFRYDLVIHVGPAAAPVAFARADWERDGLSVAAVRARLADERPDLLVVDGVPNLRLSVELRVRALLADPAGPSTVGALREAVQAAAPAGVEPEALWALADELPYVVDLRWTAADGDGRFTAVFRRRRDDGTVAPSPDLRPPDAAFAARPWAGFATDPVRASFARRLLPQLREHLTAKLPSYMVPSAFVLLERMPLSPNGKIDRRALPAADPRDREAARTVVAPRGPIEACLAELWQQVLAVDRVSVHDNWFDLGGHSLLATQLVARARKAFQLDLPMRSLFDHPTIARLAAVIEGRLLAEIEATAAEAPDTHVQRSGAV